MNTGDIAQKRSILLSARIRFSPEAQPIRDTAIDRIIEQNLFITDSGEGLTLQEMEEQGAVCFAGGTPAIRRLDMNKSLNRLVELGRIIPTESGAQSRYRLSEQAFQELEEVQQSTDSRFEKVVERLFRNAEEGSSAYATPFLECLCNIFSQLGEMYVRLIKGEVGRDEFIRSPSLRHTLEQIKLKYQSIDGALFEAAVVSFFRDSDPEYDAIKWNMAQNYYVAKVLGLDPSGKLFSKEVFGNAMFYLDTNVIIPALEPKARYHRSFKALSQACKGLQISLKTCQISLDELNHTVEYQRETIPRVANQIPDATAPKIRGVFSRLYQEQQSSTGTVDLDEVFSSFENPAKVLAESYEVELVDDVWFIEAESQPETETLAERISNEYWDKRSHVKGRRRALHDALLLRWIELERERTDKNVWLATQDTTLPNFLPRAKGASNRPLAITLDALLQWISPVAMHDDIEDEVAAIFSEAVKYMLLPQESFFDIRDFLVFAELEWSCKELPAEDVEECIRYLKRNAPDLDPSNPADREKLSNEIAKFFADPSRKYKQELQSLEAAIRERDGRIAQLEKEQRQNALRRSAVTRLLLVALLFLGLEAAACYVAWKYGEGANFWQKLGDSYYLPTAGFVTAIISSWFILGKERLRDLGWAVGKLLKSE